MAENIKALRRRLRSIKSTKQITHAMEMVSSAKLRQAQARLLAGRPYASKIQEVLGHIAESEGITHPFLEKRPVNKAVLVLVTSDRGLAGAFNAQVIKRAEQMLTDASCPSVLVCVGSKGHDYFKNKRWPVAMAIRDFNGILSAERADELADKLAEMFLDGEADVVQMLYNTFVTTLTYRQTVEQLLPLDAAQLLGDAARQGAAHQISYILEPDPKTLIATLMPLYVRSRVYISLAESFTAEHSARMVAMTNATKNSDELINTVTLRMNKARQQAITTEILEVVSGAEALKG